MIGERTNDNIGKIGDEIKSAGTIFFLGFGYAPENLDALNIPKIPNPEGTQRIIGTAYGACEREKWEIGLMLKRRFSQKILLLDPDEDCCRAIRQDL